MLLVVGLGNPGREYAGNRHNIGCMVADAIVRHYSLGRFRSKFQGYFAEGSIAGTRTGVLKPRTFMNESGRSVAAASNFFKIPSPDVLVLHDELDLAAGRLRVKRGGGHAGHNGLRSIHAHIGPDYRRLRLGIGHPGDKDRVTGHVLHDFAKSDRKWLDKLLAAVAENFQLLIEDDDPGFMTRVALAMQPPRPAKPPPGDPGPGKEGRDKDDGL